MPGHSSCKALFWFVPEKNHCPRADSKLSFCVQQKDGFCLGLLQVHLPHSETVHNHLPEVFLLRVQMHIRIFLLSEECMDLFQKTHMPVIIDFIQNECEKQKMLSESHSDDHKRDYSEINLAFRKVLEIR